MKRVDQVEAENGLTFAIFLVLFTCVVAAGYYWLKAVILGDWSPYLVWCGHEADSGMRPFIGQPACASDFLRYFEAAIWGIGTVLWVIVVTASIRILYGVARKTPINS